MVEDKKAESNARLLQTQADMVTDLVVRVSALERVLIKKNIVPENEYAAELEGITKKMAGFAKLLAEQNQNQPSPIEATDAEPNG